MIDVSLPKNVKLCLESVTRTVKLLNFDDHREMKLTVWLAVRIRKWVSRLTRFFTRLLSARWHCPAWFFSVSINLIKLRRCIKTAFILDKFSNAKTDDIYVVVNGGFECLYWRGNASMPGTGWRLLTRKGITARQRLEKGTRQSFLWKMKHFFFNELQRSWGLFFDTMFISFKKTCLFRQKYVLYMTLQMDHSRVFLKKFRLPTYKGTPRTRTHRLQRNFVGL